MNRLKADLLLLLTALIWGTAFIAQKYGNETVGPLTFVGARFFLSALVLAPLMFYESRKNHTPLARKDFGLTVIIGLSLFAASALQQIGLLTTSATHSGFLTALYVVLVPFVVWLMTKHRPRFFVIVACVISIIGAWLLADNGSSQSWSAGDILTVVSDLAWALQISLIPIFLGRTHRPFLLCFVQYAISGLLGLAAGFVTETVTLHGLSVAGPSILYAGLLSGGIGYTLQIIAQKHTPAAEASLIMSLESVFAAIAGAYLLGERLTNTATIGCLLILLGVIIVEIGPAFWRYLWICKRMPKNA